MFEEEETEKLQPSFLLNPCEERCIDWAPPILLWLGSPQDALDSPLAFYSSILDDFASILMLVSSCNQGDQK